MIFIVLSASDISVSTSLAYQSSLEKSLKMKNWEIDLSEKI